MSRIGVQPVAVPDKVEVSVTDRELTIKGPKGELSSPIPRGVSAKVEDGQVVFERTSDEKTAKAAHGLARALAANAVQGVSQGFERQLSIVGVGYRAQAQGRKVTLTLGFSHPVEFEPPEGVDVVVEDQTKLVVRGIDKQAVGQVAARLRALRPPDAYKGKGVRFTDERIKLKPGKAGTK